MLNSAKMFASNGYSIIACSFTSKSKKFWALKMGDIGPGTPGAEGNKLKC